MKDSEFVTKWVLDRVSGDLREDIALVVAHTTLNLEDDSKTVGFFVPITDRGRQFGQSFILDGVGYDIWGIEWERLERFAALLEYNTTVLADGVVLYARTPAERERFESLQRQLRENLRDEGKIEVCAMETLNRAKEIFSNLLFARKSDQRLAAGYVIDYLARAIAFANYRYFTHSQTDQIAELSAMPWIPVGFLDGYEGVITEREEGARKKRCYDLILLVEEFLRNRFAKADGKPEEQYFQDLADWYAEMAYTWLRLRHYAGAGEVIKTHMWGIYLQNELNQVYEDFGLGKAQLMEYFDPTNLAPFITRADFLEKEIRGHILRGGGVIREYRDVEAFCHEV